MVEPTVSGFSLAPILASMPFDTFATAHKNVLIVEDDAALARFLGRELECHHCSVSIAKDGQTALMTLRQNSFDLIIFNLDLSTMDGVEILANVRRFQPRLPILVLSARNHVDDRVQALRLGADDCLSKPFSYREFLARFNSLLRRDANSAAAYSISDLTVNKDERRVMRGGRRIDLTPREFAILEYMMDNIDKPVSRATLMREVWNLPFDASTNIVDVYMKYLRDKIDLEGLPKLIHTVRGIGYTLSTH
jgi:two-component system copper resistance phosphate regulon response regulator CusR